MGGTELIRLATPDDIPILLRMGEDFFNASGYGEITTFNKEDTTRLVKELIKLEAILTDGCGAMLGFVVYPLFFNSSHLVSQELFWWVDKEKRNTKVGVELLKKAENLSKKQGAKTMMMISLDELNGNKVNKIYERLGYKKRERTYMRKL